MINSPEMTLKWDCGRMGSSSGVAPQQRVGSRGTYRTVAAISGNKWSCLASVDAPQGPAQRLRHTTAA
jgi:hypothetical protein